MSFYEQTVNVIRLHNLPRFGHSNQLSSLAKEEDKDDYISGLQAFPILLICFFVVWSLLLLLLKFVAGIQRVGCAAGGQAIDMTALRAQGVRRWHRRQRMIRSWRLQTIFALASLGLIAFSFVFANQGLTPFMRSLDDTTAITNLAQTRARHGMHLAHLLSSHMTNLRPYLDLNITKLCPNYDETILETQFSLSVTAHEIVHAAKEMDRFIGDDLDPFLRGIDQVAETCGSIDSAITTAKENDWAIRLFLTSANIINLFLIFGVLLTRNKIKSEFYQDILGGLFVPAFAATMVFAVLVLCLVSAIGMINADFCAGGEGQGSPFGTLIDLVASSGYDRPEFIARVLDYYTEQQCEGANPLVFLYDLEISLVEASGRVQEISQSFRNENFEVLSRQCGSSFESVNATFSAMAPILSDLTLVTERVNDLTKCDQISPILDKLAHGVVCHESVNSLAWMYYTALVMSLLMMIMLSTRAALFNPLIPGSKKKRREKEFQQYKRFMEEFGFDTEDWQMDPAKEEKLYTELDTRTQTFDTEESDSLARLTPVTSDDKSENSFADEPNMDDEPSRLEPDGLETVEEELNESPDNDAQRDDMESVDSDDSSLNPPPSVMSGMASTLSMSISSTLRKLQHLTLPWTSVNISLDTKANGLNNRTHNQLHTPTKVPGNIFGTMDNDEIEMEELENMETVPLSPAYLPAAPQKSHKSLRRTRGSTDMAW